MTADPTEMTEEEMMQAVAFMKAQRMNQDLITNYDARVQRIQQIRVGDEIRTPYRQLSPETQRLIQAECEGQWGHYCVSSYTTTLHESTREQGYEGRDELFPKKENDKDKSYSSYTLHAKEYVENNFKDAATSLKDFPEGTT
ncbi:MAG: hypothetical protein J5647_01855, partial [Spirochaetaceae bacterium]|nr:hypothetical protein [Spirochaetaceae bacterium]